MLDNLPQNPSIPTTNHKHLLRAGMAHERQMRDHLLVAEFVALGTLDYVVEDQDGAVVCGFEDEDVLVLGFLVVEDLGDLEGHGLAGPHAGDFAEPAVCVGRSVSGGVVGLGEEGGGDEGPLIVGCVSSVIVGVVLLCLCGNL